MERFGYKGVYKFQAIMNCGYPAIGLGGMGAMYFFVVRDSGGMFQMKEWAPQAFLGLLGWLAFEVYRTARRFSFSLQISEEGIQVGSGPFRPWDQVSRAEFHGLQFGSSSVITLHLQSGEEVNIPAAIDHLPYIQGIIENKVQNVANAGK